MMESGICRGEAGCVVSLTRGGLVKRSISFTPIQLSWLRALAARRGGTSVDSIVRELVDAEMALWAQSEREAAS